MKKILTIVATVVAAFVCVIGISIGYLAHREKPYLAKCLSVSPASADMEDIDRYVDEKGGVLYVFSKRDVVACILPRATSGYNDQTMIVPKPNGQTYDQLMEFQFKYPNTGAIEAIGMYDEWDEASPEIKTVVIETTNTNAEPSGSH